MRHAWISFQQGKTQSLEDICRLLKSQGFHPAMVDRGYTNHGWQFWGQFGNGFADTDTGVFVEAETGEVLYIAIEGRTAMFRRYDSFEHALDSQPDFRRDVFIIRAIFMAKQAEAAAAAESDQGKEEQAG